MLWTILLPIAILLLSSLTMASTQRPFFLIGHMVNSLSLIEPFLQSGCNVLESDVHFSPDGSVKELFHGFPCDMGRMCYDRADLGEFLEKVNELTNPNAENGYYEKLVMLFLDLKLGSSGDKRRSGVDVLRHLLEHLWTSDGNRTKKMRVLLYVENQLNNDFIRGFIDELKNLGLEHRLKDIGFDVGVGDLEQKRHMFENLNVSANIWLGDGITNFFRPFRGDERLKLLLSVRDSTSGFVHKVYDWTVDKKHWMRKSLRLEVDGMITNEPRFMLEVLGEPEFGKDYKLATVGDDPFARFETKTV